MVNYVCMEKRIHLYVSRKNVLTWLMALCMVASAVARIAFPGLKGSGDSLYVWSQIVLPIAAALLYALVALLSGKEHFYKTAIPVWMIALYFFFVFESVAFTAYDPMVTVLYAIVMIFYGVLYKQITSEKASITWLLPIIFLVPIGALAYLLRSDILAGRYEAIFTGDITNNSLGYQAALADCLMTLGLICSCLAIRRHPLGEYHPTWGDRSDGRRVRTLPPMAQVSPYIMVTRNTSTNFFEDAFEISHIDRYIRQKRRAGLSNLGLTHVLLAGYCRTVAKFPQLNRFISGQKIYSRGNDLQFCMVIKKEMTTDSPESIIKVHLTPYDTIDDVYNKVNAAVEEVKNTPLNSDFDKTAHALLMIPGVFLKFTVWLLRTLDYFGLLPKFLLEISPFHGSVFFTSMGSLGIPPIYHHLYNFGNMPLFASFGCKRRALEVQEDGTVVQKKYMPKKRISGIRFTNVSQQPHELRLNMFQLDIPKVDTAVMASSLTDCDFATAYDTGAYSLNTELKVPAGARFITIVGSARCEVEGATHAGSTGLIHTYRLRPGAPVIRIRSSQQYGTKVYEAIFR